jgi:hypothetical protein
MGIGIAPSNIPSSSQVYAATAVKQAKPKDKPYKLADGGGLYLHVKPMVSTGDTNTGLPEHPM